MQKEDLFKLSNKELCKFLPRDFAFYLKPYKHQLVSLIWAKDKDSFGLACEMGTGKTKIVIDWLRLKGLKKILVIGVNAILENWKEEFLLNAGDDFKVVVLSGSAKEKEAVLLEDIYNVYIVNYEGLYYFGKKKEDVNFNWKCSVEDLIESVEGKVLEGLKRKWDAVVVDESRCIANVESLRSRVVLYLSNLAKHCVVISGTPVVKMLTEIFSQQYVIDKGWEFGVRPKVFLHKLYDVDYQRLGWSGRYVPVMKVKKGAEEFVKNKMSKWWIRFEKKECVDLPEKVYIDRYVLLEGDQLDDYVKMQKNSKLNVLLKNKNVLELQKALMRFMQICGGFLKIDNDVKVYKCNVKLEYLKFLLENDLCGKKVVISAIFKAEQKYIIKLLKDLGVGFTYIIGGMGVEEIKEAEKKFLYDDSVSCIVLSPKVGARGINLAVADYVVLYSMGFNYEEMVQLEDRVHRLPPNDLRDVLRNKKHIVYIRLIAKNTVDEKVVLVLNRDKKTINDLLGDLSVFNV